MNNIGTITIETNAGKEQKAISCDHLFGVAARAVCELKVFYKNEEQLKEIKTYSSLLRKNINKVDSYISLLGDGQNFYTLLHRHGAKLPQREREKFLGAIPTEITWIS